MMTLLSADPEANLLPSREYVTQNTVSLWPGYRYSYISWFNVYNNKRQKIHEKTWQHIDNMEKTIVS